ncbi:MAG: PQQ-dependent sugar dehydrogenase [Planctomycetota bacterium]
MKRVCVTAALAISACVGSATAGGYDLATIGTGFARPLYVTHAPGDPTAIYVVEQRSGNTGRIQRVDLSTGTRSTFLSVPGVSTASEQGLLGLAFSPNYEQDGEFYVNYTLPNRDTVIARYSRSSSNPLVADASSADTILVVDQPFSNHNGGWMDFGPDGYLYISLGDGGSANDPGNRSQDITNQLLGSMLRIDPFGDDFPSDANRDYAIPADNPFVGITGDDEIYYYGLRNAWRNAFDTATGDLYIADVGQNAREEINFVPTGSSGGLNFGWRCLEGTRVTGLSGCNPSDPSLVPPIHEYSHGSRCSLTGGEVYRGCAIPELDGTYFFGDYCTGEIWSLTYDGAEATVAPFSSVPPFGLTSFGRDAFGEIYICSGSNVLRIEPAGGYAANNLDCNSNSLPDCGEIALGLVDDCEGGPIGDPVIGATTFSNNCASCHAPDGTGGFGPNIRNKTRSELAGFAGASVFHPGGVFTELTNEDFANIEARLSDIGSRGRPDGIPDECQTDLPDCDNDGVTDGCELAAGTQVDMDFDGIPDDCAGCSPADVTTNNANPGDAEYGVPDGEITTADLTYFVEQWLADNAAVADVTTNATNPGDANYGVPDGEVTAADLSYFVEIWLAGCP